MREPTEDQFLKEVAGHQMAVAHEQGLYRHLRFRDPSRGWNMWFDLITWPGALTISGGMGTWTFARVEDMFTFFRSPLRRERNTRCKCDVCGKLVSSTLKINPDYWAEKLQHGTFGGREGARVWDQDTFQSSLLDQLEGYDFTPEKLAELKTAIQEEIFQRHDGDGPHMMRHAAYEFTYEFKEDRWRTGYAHQRNWKFQFEGIDLPSGMVYSYHFIWCCYAIVWGIQQWDARAAEVIRRGKES